MTYYISVFFIYYIAIIYALRISLCGLRLIFIIGFLPLIFLALLRGDVGTDTYSYLQIIAAVRNGSPVNIELGFVFLVKAIFNLVSEPRLILVLIAVITTIQLIFISTLSERALLILMFCIVPIFYLDMTMNGIRYGLSFTCASIAIAFLYRNSKSIGALWAISAVVFHVSSFALFGIMLLLAQDKKEFMLWFKLLSGLLVVVLAQLLANGVGSVGIIDKAGIYSNIPSPSPLSGLIPLTISLILLWVIKSGDKRDRGIIDDGELKILSRRFYVLLALITFAFVVAKFSYAGLRLQFLVLFGMLVAMQFKPKFAGEFTYKGNKDRLYLLIFIGFLGVVSFLKNAYLGADQGMSPWVPYTFNPYFHIVSQD